MSSTVVRRFDLRVDRDKALDDVRDLLGRLVAQESGIVHAQIKRVEALSLLAVRLPLSPGGTCGRRSRKPLTL